MRGTVAKRLRKVAKIVAEYEVDLGHDKSPDYAAKVEKRAYKRLKKNYKG